MENNTNEKSDRKKWFSRGNIFNFLFFTILLAIVFVPSAKTLMIRGLMSVGFFQPDIEQPVKPPSVTDITFKDSSGKTISLAALKGKVVFINFWATWCPPCLAELPSINTLFHQLSQNPDIVFLMVDTDRKLNRSVPFMKAHEYGLPVFEALNDIPVIMLGPSIPTTAVLNKQGQMVYNHAGIADYSGGKFVAYLQQLAKK